MTQRFTTLDRTIGIVVAVLLAFIALTLVIGDRVGVTLERVHPLGEAHSTDSIRIQFGAQMDRPTVEERLTITPPIDGEFTWSGDTFTFRPSQPLQAGQTYTVQLQPGAQSRSGRAVQDAYTYDFTVRQPLVAYLSPSDGIPQNIWMADPDDTTAPQQITFSQSGVLDFSVRPDGRAIAFSERLTDRAATDLKQLNLDTEAVTVLSDCADADCSSPVWRPDGNALAYTRVDMNTLLPGVGVSPYRIWLMDITTAPPLTQPLFEDTQVLGYGPSWSADGTEIALFDSSIPGIVVYDFEADETAVLQSDNGSSGALSPDGSHIIYPEVILEAGQAWSELILANLETQELSNLVSEEEPVDDTFAVWRPDGEAVLIGRRYRDERYTPTTQLYLVDVASGEVEPLLVDPPYNHGFVHWDPTGTKIVMQRFPQLTADGTPNQGGRPEIWTYDLETDELTQIATNAMFPRWVP